MLTATSLPSPVKRTGQDPVSYFPAHHLFRALRLSKVKSPLGIQIRDKMGMTFLIFVTQAQNLLVLDTRSFIFSMSEVNTEPQKKKKKKIYVTWYVWWTAPARIPSCKSQHCQGLNKSILDCTLDLRFKKSRFLSANKELFLFFNLKSKHKVIESVPFLALRNFWLILRGSAVNSEYSWEWLLK